ncbi:MAG: hypothetical protein E5W56_03340, partial [Mesorhizobium sp.]
MRAVIQNSVGGPDVLFVAEQPDPSPKAGEALVRVKATGINPVDGAVRGGFYPLLGEPPFILGWDISGTVEALGDGVTAFKAGDEVFGMPRFPKQAGAYAELAAGAGMDQHALARLYVAVADKALPGGEAGKRQRRCVGMIDADGLDG